MIRDAVEAEYLAAEWMASIGITNVRRLSISASSGIVSSGFGAGVFFDPLPMEYHELRGIHDWASSVGLATLCFHFAGWDDTALDFAEKRGIALVRFTFAGHVEPENAVALELISR